MGIQVYRNDLDFLKGIAIVAVVFYHASLIQSGYLGVDLFFVINGFLIIPSLCRNITKDNKMGYYPVFLRKRLIRLWPLIILATLVCLLIGFFVGMLPDDFENLSETVIASNLMSNNLLSAITIKDYWAVRATFQPLMHMWYVGILFEFYLIIPLILYATKFAAKHMHWNVDKSYLGVLSILSIVSLAIYLTPSLSDASRFYHLPSRFFELALGGIVALAFHNREGRRIDIIANRAIYYVLLLALVFCIYISLFDSNYLGQGTKIIPIGAPKDIQTYFLIFNRRYLLLIVVVLSVLIVNTDGSKWMGRLISSKNPICLLGKMSFSIYVWHQIYLAFERYFYSNQVTLGYVIFFLCTVMVVSWLTYKWIEGRIAVSNRNLTLSAIAAICISGAAFYFYQRAGVVRDVPELDVSTSHVTRNMHGNYLHRVYRYFNKGFENNKKYNVCAIGNSFARDFVNILLESSYCDSINISYLRLYNQINPKTIREADYVFIFEDPDHIPSSLLGNIERTRIYGIGTKTFGDSNGNIYKNRNKPGYYDISIKPHKEYVDLNNLWASKWGDHYINIFKQTLLDNGNVRIFTPSHKYMSQDCRHLTQAGAQFIANRIDFSTIINSHRHEQTGG